jgi:hypothetical protein
MSTIINGLVGRSELRAAARLLRCDYEREDVDSIHEAHVMLAVADLLEVQADVGEVHFTANGVAALRVARLILGGAS